MRKQRLLNDIQKILALNLSIAASFWGLNTQAFAHGGKADMVSLYQNMSEQGAKVVKDDFTNTYMITKGSMVVRAKPNSDQVLINGKPFTLSVPLLIKDGKPVIGKDFFNEVFQSGLDQTFKIENTFHPLNSLNSDEIKKTFDVINRSKYAYKNMRFAELKLKEPEKAKVWDYFINHKEFKEDRIASFILLKGSQAIEGEVNLNTQQVTKWNVLKDTHGMVLLDNFEAVQRVIETSKEYQEALRKRGITDVKKVIATPLTVGYFGGKDGLDKQLNILKVVAYLDVGDGNYWAHPIENLVAVVDLDKEKIIKIEEGSIIPVPMANRPYMSNKPVPSKLKPLNITEPEGKNFSITGQTIHWGNWCLHVALDSRVGLQLSTVTYKDKGVKRKVMYEGNLGGMVVPYGDPDIGWYFKSYLDSGEYGMGTLTSSILPGTDAPDNAVLLDAVIADYKGQPQVIPNAIAVFERYAGPEYKHHEIFGNQDASEARRELVVRWISTVGNYDYMFDWVFAQNGVIGINAGATGIEAVKGVKSRTMHDSTAKEDTKYGTLIDHNIVGTTHQHIYNFRLDMDVDGENNRADANIDEILPTLLQATFVHQGQVCASPERFFVHRAKYDELVEKLSKALSSFKIGSAMDEGSMFGPLSNQPHFHKVKHYLDMAKAKNQIIAGGETLDRSGYFVQPTLISFKNTDDPLFSEETFGPVVGIMPFETDEELVQLMNQSRFGLTASIWTNDLSKALRLIPKIEAGTLWVNMHTFLDPSVPFGGVKASGIGREFSDAFIEDYTELKSVMIRY